MKQYNKKQLSNEENKYFLEKVLFPDHGHWRSDYYLKRRQVYSAVKSLPKSNGITRLVTETKKWTFLKNMQAGACSIEGWHTDSYQQEGLAQENSF